jgi:hypothetical protein
VSSRNSPTPSSTSPTGAKNPKDCPPGLCDYLATWLPAWLDDALDLARWDLLGELLVVDACLPHPTFDEPA